MCKNDYSRRDFIRTLGLGAAVLALPVAQPWFWSTKISPG